MKKLFCCAITLLLLGIAPIKGQASAEKKYSLAGPGLELRKASRHYYIGLGCVVGGTIFAISGADGSDNTAVSIGGIAVLVGYIFMVESWSHIGKAGRMMQNSKVQVDLNNDGVGLVYRF